MAFLTMEAVASRYAIWEQRLAERFPLQLGRFLRSRHPFLERH